MEEKPFTNIRSLLRALAQALNLINHEVENHHEQTAYLAYCVGIEMGLEKEQIHTIIYAALLHDVGSIMLEEPASITEIESRAEEYAQIGADMLRDLPYFSGIASVIEYCQTNWQDIVSAGNETLECARMASICSSMKAWASSGVVMRIMSSGRLLGSIGAPPRLAQGCVRCK